MSFVKVSMLVCCLYWIAEQALAADIVSMPIERQVAEVSARLEGVMTTSAQAAANAKAPDVRMTTCRVRGVEAPAFLLYQEQAMSVSLDKPYRQRYLLIAPSSDQQTVESLTFKPTEPKLLTGLCSKPEAERVVPFRLSATAADCRVLLKPVGEDFVGNTPEQGCPANVRGAVRIT
ncbi:MAG: chorismate mutase, partial [Gemmatimonadaceae bacterium]|nr:chorismate mutase [Gloeobacterales cyanobacterium ES-bin-141]